jgi:chemotaxis response regulator CheB
MPKVAIEKGYAEMVLGLQDIVPTLIEVSLSEGERRIR